MCINWCVQHRFRCSRRNAKHFRLVKIVFCLARLGLIRICVFLLFKTTTKPGTDWTFNRIPTLSMDQKFIALDVKAKRTFRFSAFPSLLCFTRSRNVMILFGTSGVPSFIHSWFQWTIWCIKHATHVLTGLCCISIWADGVIQLKCNGRREWNWKIL